MDLALITPTRKRWHWLVKQAQRVAPQLKPDDRWIIVIDQDHAPPEAIEQLNKLIGIQRLTWCLLSYLRHEPPEARISYAHNAGSALAPASHALVEVDDHDLLESDALPAIRSALDGRAHYVFGWHRQEALLAGPNGKHYLETWPHVMPAYSPGSFGRGEIGGDGIGLRAISPDLWHSLGGWRTDVWPGGDQDFAVRAEALGAKIVCLPKFLCTVAIEADSLSANYRGVNPATAVSSEAVPQKVTA